MKRLRAAFVTLAALLGASIAAGASAQDADLPDVIVAKTQPQMVLVWRTNATIARFVEKHVAGEKLEAALLAAGEHMMFEEAVRSESKPQSVTLKLVFFHDADDPRYKIETLAGITPLGTLQATAAALRAHNGAWATALAAGRIPGGFNVDLDRDATQRAAR